MVTGVGSLPLPEFTRGACDGPGDAVQAKAPLIRPADQLFWILLRRLWSDWAVSLAIVQPDTVVRWHRAGFRSYWKWLSRRGERSALACRNVRDPIPPGLVPSRDRPSAVS